MSNFFNVYTFSFILTMWYVNLKNDAREIKKFASFILTMWYVNTLEKALIDCLRLGFILTMWYVNLAILCA